MKRRFFVFTALWLLIKAGSSADQLPGDTAIRGYLRACAVELEREFLPGIKTAADFEKARPALKADYLDMLGLKPFPERTPLKATVTGRLEMPAYTVERLHFQSRPGLYVTANLYLPRPARQRYPAILYQSGHYNKDRRNGNKSAADCQGHGIWFATHGYVALVLDTVELGEIAGIHRGTLSGNRWWWHSAGYTPAGVECWNAIRALDYLVSRPEVDPERIGATGISGGGIGTFWIAAADDRVKAAAPVSGMGDLLFYVGEDGVGRHCDCIFLYNRARWNWNVIASLISPRPMLFVNSTNDIYFPMSANERIINHLESVYARFGAGDQVDAVVSIGGHGYRTDNRRAVFEFFNRHLKGDSKRVEDPDFGLGAGGGPLIEGKALRVFPEDIDFPKDQTNTRIDELFIPVASPEIPPAGRFGEWRQDLLGRLRKAAFAAWPTTLPETSTALPGRATEEGKETTEKGVEVHWRWLPGKNGSAEPWLIVLNPGEHVTELPDWAKDIAGASPAFLLSPRGVGAGAWTRNTFPNTVERAMVLVGATADGGRVWDIMTVARRRHGIRWRAAGRGQAGILAAYAALYEPAIEAVVAVDPPSSHRPVPGADPYGPALLNVLRVLDIPEALGCLAPRPLVLVGTKDPAFERTDAIYRLAGAAHRFERR